MKFDLKNDQDFFLQMQKPTLIFSNIRTTSFYYKTQKYFTFKLSTLLI